MLDWRHLGWLKIVSFDILETNETSNTSKLVHMDMAIKTTNYSLMSEVQQLSHVICELNIC